MRMRALSLLVVLFVGARRAGDPWRLLVWIHIHNVEDEFSPAGVCATTLALDCKTSPQLCAESSIIHGAGLKSALTETSSLPLLPPGKHGRELPRASEHNRPRTDLRKPELSPLAVKALSVTPPLCFIGMQFSGWPTIQRIKAEGTTGALSPLPFVSLAVNCAVWAMYGLLKHDKTVLLPNASGLLVGCYFSHVFAQHSVKSVASILAAAAAIVAAAGALASAGPQTPALCIRSRCRALLPAARRARCCRRPRRRRRWAGWGRG